MTDNEREPTLEDVLSDPVVHALMARDRVDAEEIRALLERLRRAERRGPPGEAKAAAAHEDHPTRPGHAEVIAAGTAGAFTQAGCVSVARLMTSATVTLSTVPMAERRWPIRARVA